MIRQLFCLNNSCIAFFFRSQLKCSVMQLCPDAFVFQLTSYWVRKWTLMWWVDGSNLRFRILFLFLSSELKWLLAQSEVEPPEPDGVQDHVEHVVSVKWCFTSRTLSRSRSTSAVGILSATGRDTENPSPSQHVGEGQQVEPSDTSTSTHPLDLFISHYLLFFWIFLPINRNPGLSIAWACSSSTSV
jgi:hypothetical protein